MKNFSYSTLMPENSPTSTWGYESRNMRTAKLVTFLILVFVLNSEVSNAQVITTYAGGGATTVSGVPATSTNISYPYGINLDNNGNLLICHPTLVRKVSFSSNIVTNVAGSDTATSLGGGGDGGPATCALLVSPYDVCVDAQGNYYIADYWYNKVRKVDVASGIISVFAGTGSNGSSGDGGPATAAKFGSGITSVCIDTARKCLYVSDGWNYKIRRVDMLTNIITTFAGTGTNGFAGDGGPATNANLSRTFGVEIDKVGNVYIGDWDNKRIRKVDIATGIITTVAGNGASGYSGDGGPATAAMLKKPTAICFDTCNNLYFSDEDNNCVRKISVSTGVISTIAGNPTAGFSGDGGSALAAQFNHPTGICIDRYFNLYVSDYYNHRVRRIGLGNCNSDGTSVSATYIKKTVLIYPNPTNEVLNIENTVPNTTYHVYNMVGSALQSGTLENSSNIISLKDLPPGIYLLQLTDPDGAQTMKRIVKQ